RFLQIAISSYYKIWQFFGQIVMDCVLFPARFPASFSSVRTDTVRTLRESSPLILRYVFILSSCSHLCLRIKFMRESSRLLACADLQTAYSLNGIQDFIMFFNKSDTQAVEGVRVLLT